MPTFAYEAVDATGRTVAGQLEGESQAAALRALEQRALTPLAMRPAKLRHTAAVEGPGAKTKIRLRLHELLEFTRQLKVMLASGVTLLSTLGMLRQRAKGDYKRLLDRVAADIQRGGTLSDSLAAHPRTFDPFYVGTIQAGEAAGLHTEALDELIAYYERRAAVRREVIGALTYPVIVLLTLTGACVVLLKWVVPQFQSLFAAAKTTLPLPTRVLLGASQILNEYGNWLLGGAVVAAFVLWKLSQTPAARAAFGRLAGHLPFLGTVLYLSSVVQFSRMIALLERAGLPLLETFKVVETMLRAGPVRDLTAAARRKIAAGSSITAAVGGTRALPDLVEHMISVGEASGRIDETLLAAANHFEEEMRVKLRRLTVALEPLLTLLVSGLVLLAAMAIFLPLWELNSVLLKK